MGQPVARRHHYYDLVLGLPEESSSALVARADPRTLWSVCFGAEVVVEIKFERVVAPSVQRRGRELSEPVCLREELEKDITKLMACPDNIRHRHFLLIDERGYWPGRFTSERVASLADVHADWEERRTRYGAPYWLLKVTFPMRDESHGAPPSST